jgi:hypothetical protein
MSPERLAELRRQRALIAQHLAWIDAELAANGGPASSPAPETGASATPPTPAAPTRAVDSPDPGITGTPPSPAPPADPHLALAHARADDIIERYRSTEALDPASTRRGCITLFVGLLALGFLVILAVYYFRYMPK